MRSWIGAAIASALVVLSGCYLYIDEGDDDSVVPDAGPVFPDARPGSPDARPGAPDADLCVSIDEFLARFGDCMSYTDWQGTGMCDVPAESTALGTCADCHADGTGGILLAANCEDTFLTTRQQPYILGLITPSDDAEGCFNGFTSGSWLTYSDPGHPTYAFTEARVQAINDFFGFTYARYADPDFDCAP